MKRFCHNFKASELDSELFACRCALHLWVRADWTLTSRNRARLPTMALANPAMKALVPHLGVNMNATGEKTRRLLDWKPRSRDEAIVATAESLLRLGLVNTVR